MTTEQNTSLAPTGPTFLVTACEASADIHGARVIAAVLQQHPNARFVGVGGDNCANAGADLVAHARELGLMGFTDVLFALPRALRIMRQTVQAALDHKVQAALLIDSPEFNLRLARKLHTLGIPVVYFISPKLWATRPGRSELVRRFVERMLVIFPFEVDYYRQRGVQAEYVGNPLVEQMVDRYDKQTARQELGLTSEQRVVAMLPGSRRGEITRIAPDLGRAAQILHQQEEGLRILVPRAPTVDRQMLEQSLGTDVVEIVESKARQVLAAADVAVVAAGTATLEAVLVDVPVVMVYRVSWFSALVYRFMLKIPYISLTNIIASRFVVRELWQKALTGGAVAKEVQKLLSGDRRREILQAYRQIRQDLGQHDTAASVAKALLEESRQYKE